MNKPQYLAELGQLLIFMTRADRERTLARYGALFDAAGPDGQEALLAKLGSTTRQAIRLSRIYDAAGYEDEELDALEAGAETAVNYEDEPAATPDPAAIAEKDLPDFGQPDLPDLPDAPAAEPEPEPEPTGKSGEEDDDADYEELWGKRPTPPEKAAPAPAEAGPAAEPEEKYEEEDEQPPAQPSPAPKQSAPAVYTTVKHVMPLWVGIPLFVLIVAFIALPLAVVCLALVPTLLLPGLAVLLGAWLAFVGGLWCISIIADAAVLFGLSLILLALGLIVLWCGLWIDVAMVSGFVRALHGLADLTLGKKVTVHA